MMHFKIERKDGQFSMGGEVPTFSRHGKTWTSQNSLRNHLAQFRMSSKKAEVYADCEVVVFRMVRDPNSTIDMAALFEDYKQAEVAAKLKGESYW